MTTVNLTALSATRAKMTPGWTVDVWQNTNEGGWAAVGPHHKHEGACDEPGDPAHVKAMADAAGLVAEHNAIGVLLAVARAALALRDAHGALEIAERDELYIGPVSFSQLTGRDQFADLKVKINEAGAALLAALAKVSL